MPTKPAVDDDHVSVEVTETVVSSRSRVEYKVECNAAAAVVVIVVVVVVVGIIFGAGVLTAWGIWG